jgi:hypothetical protein
MTPDQSTRISSSYRDPSGFMFFKDGVIYRQVNRSYQDHYDHLMESGLYETLTTSGLLISHEEVDGDQAPDLEASTTGYKVLRPEFVPFISYPYEWSFSQLKDAALTTLNIQKTALDYGMTMKDSSAYNIQFLGGKPVLIDTLSFEKYNEGDPWVAYRQFCQHFLAPLALASYRHIGLNGLLRANIDGIPLDLARTLLPIRTQLRPSLQIHIHMHGRLQEKSSRDTDAKKLRTKAFPRKSFLGLIDNLESTIKGFKWRASGTEWVDYYDDDSYTAEGISHKVELVQGFLSEAQPSTVWDLGANTGLYSRLASEMGINTISFDQDPAAVDRNYRKVVEDGEERILPLVFDLNNPSPKIGWANNERMDLADRGPADMLLALALVHHLAISGNVPLGMVAEYFSSICDWAVVEFVPKEDPKIQRLLATRVDIFDDYNQAAFEQNFERFFEIRSVCPIRDSLRTLYLMRKK